MKFTPTWYKNPNLSDVPSFQELEDITGMAYDNEGYYIGPKEKPKMQLVMDQRTNRQYWAPEEYDEDAVKYGAALLDREFNSKEWWGMMNDPLLSMGEKVSVASVELVKQSTKLLAKAPTEIVAGVTGMTDAVGIDAGNLAKSVWANLNPVAYFGSQVARKGIKATAQDYVDLLKNIKTPKGEMGETAALYRASAKNWESTLDKWLPDVDDNIKAHSTLVTVGSMAGQIGGSLLLAAATSSVGGLPAVAGVFGSQQFYNLREEYLSKGYSLQSANIWAGVGAIFEGGLEALGFNQWLKYATLKPSLRNHLIAGLMESSQEMLQTGAEAALTNFSGVREETLVEVLAQIAIAGVAGFIPGAGISLVSGGIGIRTEKAQYELDKAIEQTSAPVQPTTKEGQYIKGPNAKQELELAKANKGSNQLYETVKNLANAHGITKEEQVDALFYFARNKRVQGIVGEELLEGLGKQIVAYNNQLALPDKTADKENKKAAEDITYHLSEQSVNDFRNKTKEAAEKSGLNEVEAERVAESETQIYKNLSEQFGEDVMGVKQVEFLVPTREEGKAPTIEEALAEAQVIDGQIAELKKIEGTQNQIAKLETEKGKILSRGYIDIGGTINKIVLGNFSNVTTIKHEMMHHWQNVINLMAAKGNKKAQALQKQIDKIIEDNRDYVKQDANKAAEVLTEAYELWLHTGVVTDSEQQGLFNALKQFFQSVYNSAKEITGIRMNVEIDLFFRQMTGEMPIQIREGAEEKAKVEDVGEFLLGNKKKNKNLNWEDFEGMNELLRKSNLAKKKIYDLPAFEELKQMYGFSDRQAAFVSYIYSKINGKPSASVSHTEENQKRYVEGVNKVMEATIKYAKEHKAKIEGWKVARNGFLSSIKDDGLFDTIFPQKEGEYAYNRFRSNKEYNNLALVLGGSKFVSALQIRDSNVVEMDALAEKLKAKKEKTNTSKEGYEKYFSISKTYDGKYFLHGAKENVSFSKDLTFSTKEQAEEYAKKLFETIKPYLEKGNDVVSFAGLRKGIERRKPGENIEAQKLIDVFGFRGVNFGNWTKQSERQDFLNLTYDSLLDLAEILNVPPKALSFGGTLGLAYGAQGRKGAAAHFIPEFNEINLTRKQGMGSLAHEWFHALDYYFGNVAQGKDFSGKNILDENKAGGVREEVFAAFERLRKAMTKKPATKEEMEAAKERLINNSKARIEFFIEDLKRTYRNEKNLDKLVKIAQKLAKSKSVTPEQFSAMTKEFVDLLGARRKAGNTITLSKHLFWIQGPVASIKRANEMTELLKDTTYLEEARALDKQNNHKKGYFVLNTEMGARAFTSYILDKLEEKDQQNFFLVRRDQREPDVLKWQKEADKAKAANKDLPSVKEFLLNWNPVVPEERKAIKEAFDNLFSVLKTKETNKGITFYQTVKAQQTGSKAADAKPSAEQVEKDLEIIKNNGVEKHQKKAGFGGIGDWAKYALLSVRQRAGAIDPKLKAFFDKLDYFQPALEKKFADYSKGFFKKYKELTETEKNIFDYYIYNQLHDNLKSFLKEKGMEKEYQDVRSLLNFVFSAGNMAGVDMGFIEEYFPTSMIDHAGFMDHMKGTDKWSYIEKSLREADPDGLWDSKQRAEAVNKLLRGYKLTDPTFKPSNAKERTILYKSPELMKFYEHSDVALMKYLQGMSRAIAINKAFGKGKGFNTDETIGAIVLELIESGTITRKEEEVVKNLLKSRLSYRATPAFLSMTKNIGYLSMMNNITSAITQLGDLYAPFYKYSFGTAIEAIFGKKELTRKDLGLDKIWEEFSNEKWHGIAVDKLFKAVGLDAMDSFGKKAAMQASLLNLRKQAESGDVALLARVTSAFGKDGAKVLKDIKEGKVTEEVKILVFSDLADTQPIGKSGVPEGYLNHPNLRIFYQLKTFMLNQISLFYADSLVDIQKGIQFKNKKQFLRGVGNGFKLLLLLTAGNATADTLKNLIMGREIDLEDTVVSNLLWNIGVSKYTFYKGQREGYVWALFSNYFMPPQVGTADDVYRDARRMAQGKQELKDSMLATFVPFGRMYYWWFGGGSEQGKKRKEKLTKKVNAKNRMKNKNKRREK